MESKASKETIELWLSEWKSAMENARHFNDLLIRFRMSGLPVVITLAIAGIASTQFVGKIAVWSGTIPSINLFISIIASIALIWHSIQKLRPTNKEDGKNKQESTLPFYWFEFSLWAFFTVVSWIFSVFDICSLVRSKELFIFNSTSTIPFTPIALTAAVTLLIALYVMDRFYYYKLLTGAISRLLVLENTLGFEITSNTSQFMPISYATNLITFFYALPGVILLIISFVSAS